MRRSGTHEGDAVLALVTDLNNLIKGLGKLKSTPNEKSRMKVRVAARGSGAGSFINHLLGISGVDPIKHNLGWSLSFLAGVPGRTR